MKNSIWHVEMATTDKQASAQFLGDLFGWPFQVFQPMDYTMTDFPEGKTTLALDPVKEEQGVLPGGVLVYVDVEDVDATLARAQELEATILTGKFEIPGPGWMAVIGVPGGNRIAVMQRMPPASE
jgi:predicted enzyme related to lactoylglutathione lyase